MTDPKLVMLDEPMAGVNPALTQSLLDHILDLKDEGMTVLFVEHDMHMVRHIADWVVVMAEGRIVAEGDPYTVMRNPAVIDAYLGAHQDARPRRRHGPHRGRRRGPDDGCRGVDRRRAPSSSIGAGVAEREAQEERQVSTDVTTAHARSSSSTTCTPATCRA